MNFFKNLSPPYTTQSFFYALFFLYGLFFSYSIKTICLSFPFTSLFTFFFIFCFIIVLLPFFLFLFSSPKRHFIFKHILSKPFFLCLFTLLGSTCAFFLFFLLSVSIHEQYTEYHVEYYSLFFYTHCFATLVLSQICFLFCFSLFFIQK
jgi:hypothetical protein